MLCWKHREHEDMVQIYCGIALICYFGVAGILSFSIPCGRYNAAKEAGLEYEGPGASMIALHWLFYLSGVVGGLGLMFTVQNFAPFMILVLIGSIGLFSMWLVYMILFYLLEWLVIFDYDVISIAQFRAMNEMALKATPAYEIYASGWRKAFKTAYPCETRKEYINVTVNEASTDMIWLDESNIGNRAFRVRTTIAMIANETDRLIVETARNTVDDCARKLDRVSKVVAHADGFIDGFNREVIVTKDGKKPASMNKAAGGVAGFFSFGIVYLYDLGRTIPILPYTIEKNVSIVPDPPQLTCEDFPSCMTS